MRTRKLRRASSSKSPTAWKLFSGRIHIAKINGPFLFEYGGSPTEYGAGLKRAIENGWLWKHESGVYEKLTEGGAALFAEEASSRDNHERLTKSGLRPHTPRNRTVLTLEQGSAPARPRKSSRI